MYKVMIVDDEMLVRVGLKSTIEWEKLGFTIVADATNGEQAFELYKLHKPDVVLTDIKMPKMDGLELLELIKADKPNTKVLILTCYDEFSFARKALKLGASGYILKSEIEDEELISLLNKLHEELELENGSMEKYYKLEKQMISNIDFLKEKLLSDLTDLDFVNNKKQFISRCENLNFNIEGKELLLLIVKKEDIKENSTFLEKDMELLNFAILNIALEILREKGYNCLYTRKDKNIIILTEKDNIYIKDLELEVKRIKESVHQYLNVDLCFIMSKKYNNILSTGEIYKECLKSMQILFYNNTESYFSSIDCNFFDMNITELNETYHKQLFESLENKDLRNAIDIFLNLEKYFKDRKVLPQKAKMFYSSLVSYILDYCANNLAAKSEINEDTETMDSIYNAERLIDITKCIKPFLVKIFNYIEDLSTNNSNSIIVKTTGYIKKNYNEDISLQTLASYLNLSKHYLCYLFKKETGENISHYINKTRIDNAKNLLKRADYKGKEIYDMVGFSDQQYFCKVFKKITGMTVAQYRESGSKHA